MYYIYVYINRLVTFCGTYPVHFCTFLLHRCYIFAIVPWWGCQEQMAAFQAEELRRRANAAEAKAGAAMAAVEEASQAPAN